ncbi:hypothetical protein GE09DRAFT_974142 [Coniochaeta sp. 2T2.1]|nr:hypothetical protein GE09DRAFT_974142 [Coniochaeta sp. 2T2.1]
MAVPKRLNACHLLQQNGVPSAFWFEDAIAYYGVPTIVFDVFLLVSDIDEAAAVLTESGWGPPPTRISDRYHFLNQPPPLRCRRLVPPDAEAGDATASRPSRPAFYNPHSPTVTMLLRAADWEFSPEKHLQTSQDTFIPPLSALADSLIGVLLDLPDCSDVQRHVSVQLSYLYGHVKQVNEKSFADQLRYEHRQFHFDCLAGMTMGTIPFIVHERAIRDSLRRGEYELQDCSAAKTEENRILFEGMGTQVHTAAETADATNASRRALYAWCC